MTDKVQKIREEVERLKSQLLRGACSSQVAMDTRCKEEAYNEVLGILDTMQEEPEEHDVCRFCEQKDSCVDTCFVKLVEKQRYPMSIAEKMYRELPVTINGKIEWYDCPFLNYNEEEFFQAIEKMMLKIGDKVKIMISKEQ